MHNNQRTLLEKIDRIGGKKAIAALFGIALPSVYAWTYTGQIPPDRARVLELLFPTIFPADLNYEPCRDVALAKGIFPERVVEWAKKAGLDSKSEQAEEDYSRLRSFFPEAFPVAALTEDGGNL